MPIHYNSPDHVKERSSVEALTLAQSKEAVSIINRMISFIEYEDLSLIKGQYLKNQYAIDLLQSFVWRYENLEHAALTQPKWISVDEALPECQDNNRGKTVIIMVWVDKGDDKGENFAYYVKGKFKKRDWFSSFSNVTHWMPLPNSPKL